MTHSFRTAALSGAVIATLGLCSTAFAGGRPDLVLSGLKAGRAHQTDEIIVTYRDGTSAAQQSAVRQGLGANKIETVRGGSAKHGEISLMKLPAGVSVAAAVRGYPNANIIAVASTTSTGAMSSFSQYGATTVDIGAPGSGIWSTVPKKVRGKVVAGYASYNGTSMATPHVTGAAALYKSSHSGASAADVKAAILAAAVPTPSLNGKVVSNGRLNVSGF